MVQISAPKPPGGVTCTHGNADLRSAQPAEGGRREGPPVPRWPLLAENPSVRRDPSIGVADTVRSAAGPVPAPRKGGRQGTARGPAGRCADRRSAFPCPYAIPIGGVPVGPPFSQQLGRPLVGIARESETRADDSAPYQRERRALNQPRMARALTAPGARSRAFLMTRGERKPARSRRFLPVGAVQPEPQRENRAEKAGNQAVKAVVSYLTASRGSEGRPRRVRRDQDEASERL